MVSAEINCRSLVVSLPLSLSPEQGQFLCLPRRPEAEGHTPCSPPGWAAGASGHLWSRRRAAKVPRAAWQVRASTSDQWHCAPQEQGQG